MDRVTPVRLQRKRMKGFYIKSPNGLPIIYVGRPTKWGNPFKITPERTQTEAVIAFRIWLFVDGCHANMTKKKQWILENLPRLKGKNLSCFCKEGTPCHADVLLEIANRE